MAPVRRPPALAVGHQGQQVGLHGIEIQASEGLAVVKVAAEWVGRWMVLMQQSQVDLLRPPVLIGGSARWCCGGTMAAEWATHFRHRHVLLGVSGLVSPR